MALMRRPKPEIKLAIREVRPEIKIERGRIDDDPLRRVWGGYVLDVPESCPRHIVIDTNDRFEVRATEAIFCKYYCPENTSIKCEAGNWLLSTSKARIKMLRSGSEE